MPVPSSSSTSMHIRSTQQLLHGNYIGFQVTYTLCILSYFCSLGGKTLFIYQEHRNTLTTSLQRRLDRCQLTGNWLTAIPSKIVHTHLSQQEFQDSLCL